MLSIFALASCECEKYECPAFSQKDNNNWLPQKETLVFESETSSKNIVVDITSKALSEKYGERETTLAINCNSNDCYATAEIIGNTQSMAGQAQMNLSINVVNTFDENKLVQSTLHYAFGNMNSSFSIQPTLLSNGPLGNDRYADSIKDMNTGTRIYPNTLIQSIVPNNATEIIKTYWCEGFGLIGFVDRTGERYWIAR